MRESEEKGKWKVPFDIIHVETSKDYETMAHYMRVLVETIDGKRHEIISRVEDTGGPALTSQQAIAHIAIPGIVQRIRHIVAQLGGDPYSKERQRYGRAY